MAIYTIYNYITGTTTNYDKEGAIKELKHLVTIEDMTDNIHWKNKPVWTNANDNALSIFNKCVDSFIEWLFELVPLNGVGVGFEHFSINISNVYNWKNSIYTKEELLALIIAKTDDWFRMATDWFNKEYSYNYDAPFDLSWTYIFREDFEHSTYNNDFSDRLLNNYYDYLEDNLAYEVETGNIKLTDELTGEITKVIMTE